MACFSSGTYPLCITRENFPADREQRGTILAERAYMQAAGPHQNPDTSLPHDLWYPSPGHSSALPISFLDPEALVYVLEHEWIHIREWMWG